MTHHGMHFAVVADKLDLSLTERRKKYDFYCVLNILVYMTEVVCDNCVHAVLS